jgi:glycosyltransferase involved in cell wall biosynthesis
LTPESKVQRVRDFENVIKTIALEETGTILHVSAGKTFGGVERMLMAFASSSFANKQYQHRFALCFEGLLTESLRKANVKPVIFGPARRLDFFHRFVAGKKLESTIKKESAKAVIFHGDWVFDLFGSTARKCGLKLIKMLHNVSSDGHFIWKWSKAFSPPDLVIANSSFTAAWYLGRNPEANIAVAYPPVLIKQDFDSETECKSVLRKLGIRGGTKVILTAARFEHGKGYDILIDALSLLNPEINWVWLIAGAPHDQSEAKVHANLIVRARAKLAQNRVIWLGHVENLEPYYLCSDVYCQPNRFPESYGLTFAEASHLGCRVLTTDIGAAKEVLKENGNHIFVPEPDHSLFASELARILDGSSPFRA